MPPPPASKHCHSLCPNEQSRHETSHLGISPRNPRRMYPAPLQSHTLLCGSGHLLVTWHPPSASPEELRSPPFFCRLSCAALPLCSSDAHTSRPHVFLSPRFFSSFWPHNVIIDDTGGGIKETLDSSLPSFPSLPDYFAGGHSTRLFCKWMLDLSLGWQWPLATTTMRNLGHHHSRIFRFVAPSNPFPCLTCSGPQV